MKQYTERHVILLTTKQVNSLHILKDYNVNVNQFIRSAIAEKLKRDWKNIKEEKERVKLPF